VAVMSLGTVSGGSDVAWTVCSGSDVAWDSVRWNNAVSQKARLSFTN